MSANKPTTATVWADPDDAPELTDAFFKQAAEYNGTTLVRRGRPPADKRKVASSVRYDAEVLEAFRASGPGWQGRMNAVLADWLKTHKPEDVRL